MTFNTARTILAIKFYGTEEGKEINKILNQVDDDPWHTDTPTEEGWYLCKVISSEEDDENKFIPYYILAYKDNEFRTKITDFVVPKEHIIKWQKIEEKEDDET